jgi:hypothetical protein
MFGREVPGQLSVPDGGSGERYRVGGQNFAVEAALYVNAGGRCGEVAAWTEKDKNELE